MGGTPPLYGQNFRQIGGYGFGGVPPPFTDKTRKVVFEVLPYRVFFLTGTTYKFLMFVCSEICRTIELGPP